MAASADMMVSYSMPSANLDSSTILASVYDYTVSSLK